jgi:hypothetical protein
MGGEPAGHTGHMSHIGMQTEAGAALTIAALHTLAMFTGGAAMAWAVYRYVGLQFLKKSWFNLEALWSLSLILAGAAGVWRAVS